MRLHAHFGELPIEGFKHCGDRKIKPQGGGGIPIVSDVAEGIGNLVGGAVDTVKDLGRDIDDFVNEEIPGGWLTVGAATGAGLYGTGALGGAAATEAGAGITAESLASSAAADFVAADAASLAASGLTESQIASTLASSGVEGFVAADAASLASQGLTQAQIAQNLAATSIPYTSVTGAPVVDLSRGAIVTDKGYVISDMTLPSQIATTEAGLEAAALGAAKPLSVGTVLSGANMARGLLGGTPQQQSTGGQQLASSSPTGGVDYSGLLELLKTKANRPDILNLLG